MLAATALERRIAAMIEPAVQGMGFDLVRVKTIGSGKTMTLQIMAERPDGTMEVEDCAELSRALSALLDVEDPIPNEYTLEISSPGLDRPLTREQDFDAFAGRPAFLETIALIDGRKRFKGVLKGRDEAGDVLIEGADFGLKALPLTELAGAKLMIDEDVLRADLRAAKGEAS